MMRRVALFGALLSISAGVFGQEVQDLKGKAMPAWNMTATTGKKMSSKDLKGKVYIVDFWATWCGPCRMMSSVLEEVYHKYSKKGLRVIGADCSERDNTALPLNMAHQKHAYTITKENDPLAEKLGVVGLPTVLVVDKKGTVRDVLVGVPRSGPAYFEELVGKLLKE